MTPEQAALVPETPIPTPGQTESSSPASIHGALMKRCGELRRAATELGADVTMRTAIVDPNVATHLAETLVAVDKILTDIHLLSGELAEVIAPFQLAQASAALARAEDDQPVQINVGPGGEPIDGWINLDIVGGDVLADCRRPLPFPDLSVSRIYACHVLEHLCHPHEAWHFLAECRRVLRRGGKLRVVVPNIAVYLQSYVDQDESFWDTHRRNWTWPTDVNRLDQILRYAGTAGSQDDFFGHRHGYDEASLIELLYSAGFAPVKVSSYQGSGDPEFQIDNHSTVAHVAHNGVPLSLFVEASSIF